VEDSVGIRRRGVVSEVLISRMNVSVEAKVRQAEDLYLHWILSNRGRSVVKAAGSQRSQHRYSPRSVAVLCWDHWQDNKQNEARLVGTKVICVMCTVRRK
jgi:hypothetical protein